MMTTHASNDNNNNSAPQAPEEGQQASSSASFSLFSNPSSSSSLSAALTCADGAIDDLHPPLPTPHAEASPTPITCNKSSDTNNNNNNNNNNKEEEEEKKEGEQTVDTTNSRTLLARRRQALRLEAIRSSHEEEEAAAAAGDTLHRDDAEGGPATSTAAAASVLVVDHMADMLPSVSAYAPYWLNYFVHDANGTIIYPVVGEPHPTAKKQTPTPGAVTPPALLMDTDVDAPEPAPMSPSLFFVDEDDRASSSTATAVDHGGVWHPPSRPASPPLCAASGYYHPQHASASSSFSAYAHSPPRGREENAFTPTDDLAPLLKRLEHRIDEMHRAHQYLYTENSVLRARQDERQQLLNEITLQQRDALGARLDVIDAQQRQLLQQQDALLRALKLFSVSFEIAGARAPLYGGSRPTGSF